MKYRKKPVVIEEFDKLTLTDDSIYN